MRSNAPPNDHNTDRRVEAHQCQAERNDACMSPTLDMLLLLSQRSLNQVRKAVKVLVVDERSRLVEAVASDCSAAVAALA